MEKIILLVDALKFKAETLDFAAYVSRLARSKIVGVFVENKVLEATPAVKTLGGTAYVEEITETADDRHKREDTLRHNIAVFKEGCVQREVAAIVHHDVGNPLELIVEESRFADMIIADASFSLGEDNKVPSKFIMDVISKAECPVLIAPEYFEKIDEVVFAYDGSRSSAFAIKQFYYQLPKLADRRVVVLHINKEAAAKDKIRANFKEWMDMHFANINFLELVGEPRDVLLEYFLSKNDEHGKLLVTGAFGRSFLSTFFKPSAAELVLKVTDIPIFITHH